MPSISAPSISAPPGSSRNPSAGETRSRRGQYSPAVDKALTDAGPALAFLTGCFGGLILSGDMPHNRLAA